MMDQTLQQLTLIVERSPCARRLYGLSKAEEAVFQHKASEAVKKKHTNKKTSLVAIEMARAEDNVSVSLCVLYHVEPGERKWSKPMRIEARMRGLVEKVRKG